MKNREKKHVAKTGQQYIMWQWLHCYD